MQINAISSYNKGFTGKRDRIDEAIVQDDKAIRDYAAYKTLDNVKEDKHKKISNALWYSIPVVAGLSAAILSNGKSSLFKKDVSGLAARVADGVKEALPWAVTLGTVDAVIGANKFITNNSPTAREVERKHPLLTIGGIFATGWTALMVLPKGLSKLYGKIGPKTMGKLAKGVEASAKAINKIKAPKIMKNFASSISKSAPSALKAATKAAIDVAPTAVLLASLLHSVNHSHDRNKEFNKNYSGMKEAQLNLAKARVRELKLENDFLKQFPENVENLELLKKPKKDIEA